MNSSQNAIAVLYRKYWQKLYIHAYNLLNDGESAKDVLSDVFCSVLENSEQFEGKTDLLPLFYLRSPDTLWQSNRYKVLPSIFPHSGSLHSDDVCGQCNGFSP